MKSIFGILTLVGAITLSANAVSSSEPAVKLQPIDNYVRQVFFEGVPYEESIKYPASEAPTLINMLNDPAEEAHWTNAAVVALMIGGSEVLEPVIQFIEKDPGTVLTRENYAAKTNALIGMGYLVHRTGNKDALNYLIKGTDPSVWEAKGISGIVDYHASGDERNQDMSKYAIIGLALSGTAEAEQALYELQKPSPLLETQAFRQSVGDVVLEAIQANQQIAKDGMLEYYGSEHDHQH